MFIKTTALLLLSLSGTCIIDIDKPCDPDLICTQVITCEDGKLYPTGCGPDNCDASIGRCDKEECDPELVCGEAETCVDGKLYPTTCGPANCDAPIGNCE